MSNPIDLVVTKEAIKGLEDLISKLNVADAELLQISQTALGFKKNISNINSPGDLKGYIAQNATLNTQLQKQAETSARLQAQIEKQRLSEIRLAQQREKAVDQYTKQEEKAQAVLSKAENVYNKIQAKVNSMIPTYNSLQAKQQIGIRLTAKEESQLTLLTNRLNKYQTVLKDTDALIGKHQREVGNYAKGNSNLSASFGQIARELPNFGQSFSVGILSLTNNIGQFQDAIKQVVAQNKILKEEGKATTSAMSQIAKQLFSFNVLMYVGIGLFSAYSKEISEWVSSLWEGNAALKEFNETQKEINKTRITGKKDAQSEIIELKKYLAVVKDRKLTDEERNIALKQLRQQYPFYFKNLTDEQILLGKTAEAQQILNLALEKRKSVEKATELNVKNQQKLIDLAVELRSIKEIEKEAEKAYKAQLKRTIPIADRGTAQVQRSKIVDLENKYNAAVAKRVEIEKNMKVYTDASTINEAYIIKLKKETIGLEYQEEKQRKTKIKQLKELNLADIPASEYALMKAILDAEINNNQEIYENDKKTNEERAKSFELLQLRKAQLATLDMNEQIRLENIATAELLSQKRLSEQQKADIITQNNLNIQKIEFDHAQKIIGITEDTVGKIKELYDRVSNQARLNIIDQQELDDIRQLNLLLTNLTIESDLKRYKNAKKIEIEISKNAAQRRIENELRVINNEIETFKISEDNIEALVLLQNKRIAKEKELAVAKKEAAKEEAARIEQLKIQTQEYFRSIQAGFLDKAGLGSLNFFLKLDENGKSTFDRLIEGAENFGQKAAIVFNGIAEITQEVFAFMNQNSEKRFQAEFDRLQAQKDTAIKFAGESTVAKEEIERQYEQKRQQIEKRKLESQKKAAIFNILIDTAQAVVSAIAEVAFPANIGVAALYAGLGAAQIAMVNNQSVPAYEHGTLDHPGGNMLVNDARGTNYKETIVTPDGKISQPGQRNVLMNKPKGTKVYTPEQWQEKQLRDMLFAEGIDMANRKSSGVEINMQNTSIGLSKADFDNGINTLSKTISDREGLVIMKDARGEKLYLRKQGQMTELVNNRLNIKSFYV